MNIDHNIPGKREYRRKLAHRQIQQQGHGTRSSSGVPGMSHGGGEFDVCHTLATNRFWSDLYATLVADEAGRPSAFIFPTRATPILCRAKDAFAEQPTWFRFERQVVDRLGNRHLAMAPAAYLLWRCQADTQPGHGSVLKHREAPLQALGR